MQMLQIPVLKCCSGSHGDRCKPTKIWVDEMMLVGTFMTCASVSRAATASEAKFQGSKIGVLQTTLH